MSNRAVTVPVIVMILLPRILFAFCFEEAAKEYNVPVDLLRSIAKVESNNDPLAIGYNKNGTIDYGVMQINSWWYTKLGHKQWTNLTADTCSNIKAGAWILSQCMQRYGNTPEAIGCYNAVSPEQRATYADKVLRALKQASYPPSHPVTLARSAPTQTTPVDSQLFFPKSSSLFFKSEEGR